MPRPRVKIELDPIDWLLEIAGLIGLILLIILPYYYYDKLPDSIPRHFDFTGKPDGFSDKKVIWTLPLIGGVMYIGLAILNRFPHIFNYLQEITEENAKQQYRNATKLIRILNTILVYVFLYIAYASIQTALGNQKGLSPWFTVIFITGMSLPLLIYLIQNFKKQT